MSEYNQALHNRVEVIVWEIIKEYTDFRRCLLEPKKVAAGGLDNDPDQC